MTDEKVSAANKDSFKERLILVEEQQRNQKEVLMEINDTLKEVVKTQYVLANQKDDLDRFSKDLEALSKKFHERELRRAKEDGISEGQQRLLNETADAVTNKVLPFQNKMKAYIGIFTLVVSGFWSIVFLVLKSIFGF